MSLKTLVKDPDESKIYVIDFSSLLATGETLSSPTVTASPSGLTIGTPVISSGTVQVRISGGTVDTQYSIDVTVNTSLSNVLNDTVYLNVKNTGWLYELILMLRYMIWDISSTDYSDESLRNLILIASQLVNQEITFSTTYTINFGNASISPDPTATATRDNAFINLVVLKAACLTDQAMAKRKAKLEGVRASLGPAALNVGGHLAGYLKILESPGGACAMYEQMRLQYTCGNVNIVRAILSPFVGNDFDPQDLNSFYSLPRED